MPWCSVRITHCSIAKTFPRKQALPSHVLVPDLSPSAAQNRWSSYSYNRNFQNTVTKKIKNPTNPLPCKQDIALEMINPLANRYQSRTGLARANPELVSDHHRTEQGSCSIKTNIN